jgi:ligand-binding sensor domain-containing protein
MPLTVVSLMPRIFIAQDLTLGTIQQLVRRVSFLNRKAAIVVAISIVLAVFIGAWRIENRTQRQLDEERERLAKQNLVPFEKKQGVTFASKELTIWQSYRSSRAIAKFKDSYFVATDGGLVELGPSGNLLRHYSVLDGLPESDLLCLATFGGSLFIGTRTQGLVSFDGDRFESYRWTDRVPQAITALLEDGVRLLIGTMAGGLIEFDGRQFKEIKVGADHKRLSGIIYLSKHGARLFIGTFADGLWIEEGAHWSHFTVADELLSNRIVGVATTRDNLFVVSDYGVSVAPFSSLSIEPTRSRANLFRTITILPTLSSIVEFQSTILLCKDDGESFVLLESDNSSQPTQVSALRWKRPDDLTDCRLMVLDRRAWLLSSGGIQVAEIDREEAGEPSPLAFTPFGRFVDNQSLTTNPISALAFDSQGRIWAGNFRNGIDVLNSDGRKLVHLESDAAHEINSISENQDGKSFLVATSQSVLRFNTDFQEIEHWSTADGLLSTSVSQVVQTSANADSGRSLGNHAQLAVIACATSKGLALGQRGKLRNLTTVQGLPSNSVYTVLVQGRRLYAGTLGGLAVIEDGRVVHVFKDTNSKLTHNWITALCLAGSRLFVGTYGGGVFELTPANELNSFASETGRSVVNPNAIWSDGSRLYVGTLDGALIFDLHSQKWMRVKDELPAGTVLSVTGDDRYIYFGTTSGIARIERSYL